MNGKAISEWMLSRRKPQPVTCAWPGCGKSFEAIKRSEGNYCSQACRSKAYRARRAPARPAGAEEQGDHHAST